MPEITASLVKELRDKIGAGMMDCKRALSESGGEIEAAVDWLRKAGLAAAAKKAGRVAAEGLVAVATVDGKGVAVEVNAETDFVARNDAFKAFVASVAQVALDKGGDVAAIETTALPDAQAQAEGRRRHVSKSERLVPTPKGYVPTWGYRGFGRGDRRRVGI